MALMFFEMSLLLQRDEPLFFGREADKYYLLQQILANRLTVLTGPSGTGKSSLLNAGIVPRLIREGFGVVIGQPDRRDYAQTQLIDFTVSAKGGAARYLQTMFGISPENVISAPDTSRGGAPYRLIIGADYQPCRSP